MMRRSPIGQHGATRVRRERDRAALRRQVVLLACGMLTACGFVLAAGQHFKAVRYGYESEQLREERARLVAERERLTLELNQATAPGALEQAARGIGMQPARASQIGDTRRGDDAQAADTRDETSRRGVIETRAITSTSHKNSAGGPHAHAVAAR